MHSHIGCICLSFLHCVFSHVSSNRLPERMQSHIGCICLTFLRCAFSNVSSNGLPEKMQSHTDCICLTFLHCAFSNVPSKVLPELMQSHTGCTCLASCSSHNFQDFDPSHMIQLWLWSLMKGKRMDLPRQHYWCLIETDLKIRFHFWIAKKWKFKTSCCFFYHLLDWYIITNKSLILKGCNWNLGERWSK